MLSMSDPYMHLQQGSLSRRCIHLFRYMCNGYRDWIINKHFRNSEHHLLSSMSSGEHPLRVGSALKPRLHIFLHSQSRSVLKGAIPRNMARQDCPTKCYRSPAPLLRRELATTRDHQDNGIRYCGPQLQSYQPAPLKPTRTSI